MGHRCSRKKSPHLGRSGANGRKLVSDNALLAQRFDLRGTDAQPVAENLRVVPSEHRRSQRTPRGTVDPHRSGRHLEVAVLGVMDRLQDAALFKVRIVLNLPRVQERTGRNADVANKLHRLLLGVLPGPLADDFVDLGAAFDARIHRRIAFVADRILATDQLFRRRFQCSGSARLAVM